jgi:Putative peptidoglycan binding domain
MIALYFCASSTRAIQAIIAAACLLELSCFSQPVYAEDLVSKTRRDRLSDTASIDCEKVHSNPTTSTVARILCAGKDGASADWDLNSVLAAKAGINGADQNKVFDVEQDLWRASLNLRCKVQKPMDYNAVSPEQERCVIAGFHDRARFLRATLSGIALAESKLTPEDHAEIQDRLKQSGFFDGQVNGEFAVSTRTAIRKYQLAKNQSPTGFLSQSELADLRAAYRRLNDDDQNPPAKPRTTDVIPAPESEKHPETKPETSASLKLCAEAIDDPLKPMIIDIFVSGGKHLGGGLKNVKADLDEDYGALITVNNDAVVERVDKVTGKVGCSVSYSADIKALAGKVLEQGATGRAQILIRQMSQQGDTVERRITYTVQGTSGGSYLVWFGLTDEPRSRLAPRTRCVLAYGGMCMLFR